ncbi:hypothetical protein CRYUN_Cryun14cG0100600 [Craigia yunnanensis]
MLMRYVRASFSAAHFFSTEAEATEVEKAVTTIEGTAKSGDGGGGGRDTLGWRLIGLVYPKHSAVVTIRKWKEEGHTVRKYELNRVVRELRKIKRYKHALEICESMRLQQDIKLLPGDYAKLSIPYCFSSAQHSVPYNKVGLTAVLYNLPFNLKGILRLHLTAVLYNLPFNLKGILRLHKTPVALLHLSHPVLILWLTSPSISPSF